MFNLWNMLYMMKCWFVLKWWKCLHLWSCGFKMFKIFNISTKTELHCGTFGIFWIRMVRYLSIFNIAKPRFNIFNILNSSTFQTCGCNCSKCSSFKTFVCATWNFLHVSNPRVSKMLKCFQCLIDEI